MTARPRTPRKDGQATRASIKRAARQLFVELGCERTTVRAIAERAGCNPALISRYFGGKANLFVMIARDRPLDDTDQHSLLDVPVRSWGHVLVHRQIRRAEQASRDHLHDQLLMLLRSATTARGARTLSDFLDREDNQLKPEHLAGPDAPLRTMLVQAQLVGLTVLRDIARLPKLREADAETIAHYLGPALQQLLQPNQDHAVRPAPDAMPLSIS